MCTFQEITEYFKLKVILAFGTVSVGAAPPPLCAFRWTVGDGQVGISFWFRTAWVKMYWLVLLLIQFPSLTAITAAKHLELILSSTSDEMKCYQESPYQPQEESFNSFLHRTLAWNASFTWNIFSMLWRQILKKNETKMFHALLPSWNVTCILVISVTLWHPTQYFYSLPMCLAVIAEERVIATVFLPDLDCLLLDQLCSFCYHGRSSVTLMLGWAIPPINTALPPLRLKHILRRNQ